MAVSMEELNNQCSTTGHAPSSYIQPNSVPQLFSCITFYQQQTPVYLPISPPAIGSPYFGQTHQHTASCQPIMWNDMLFMLPHLVLQQKKTKPLHNQNYCWMHGYSISKSHTSMTCTSEAPRHVLWATRLNTCWGSTARIEGLNAPSSWLGMGRDHSFKLNKITSSSTFLN